MNNAFMRLQFQRNQTTSTGLGRCETKVVRQLAGPENEEIEENSSAGTMARMVILLVSDDASFNHRLRAAAKTEAHIVIQVESLSDALRTVRTKCAQTVVLDLDFNGELAWDAAECLLETPGCPPMILTTGRTDQFDMKMAINAGAILDKTSESGRILETVDKVLKTSPADLAERNHLQRVMIRWLKPRHWPMPSLCAHRWWGINE